MTRLRIATWNLERPASANARRTRAQLESIAEVDADVWVLTETRASYAMPAEYRHTRLAPSHPDRREDEDERWVGIWSRIPLRDARIAASPWTAAALVEGNGAQFTLYGTVLPWHAEKGTDGKARHWEVFGQELARQAEEWRAQSAAGPLCVIGDLNQTWSVGADRYGTKATRGALSDGVSKAELVVETEHSVEDSRARVDHVLVSENLHKRSRGPTTWSRLNARNVRMSDHPCVAIDLDLPAA